MSTHHTPSRHILPLAPPETSLAGSRRASTCTGHSAAQGEPLAGTAGSAIAWLLVEHPGPWQHSAVEHALGQHLAGEVKRRAPVVKVVLIRRPGKRTVERPLCYLAWTGGSPGTRPWMREVNLDTYDDILRLDLEALAGGRPVDVGTERHAPLYAVCTNGRRDACCAEFGRPVAAALAEQEDGVWECTHVGGHRLGANLVCFPHGLYYGRMTPDSALAAADDYRNGHLRLETLRGRSGAPPAAQVAEHFVRGREGLTAIDAVQPGTPTPVDAPQADEADVDQRGDPPEVDVPVAVAGRDGADRRFAVRLRRAPVGTPVPGGCDDTLPEQRFTWALDNLIDVTPSYR